MDEIKELREEIAKLRERIAVLESAKAVRPLELDKVSEQMRRVKEQYEKERYTRVEPYRDPFQVGRYFLQPQFTTHCSGVIC